MLKRNRTAVQGDLFGNLPAEVKGGPAKSAPNTTKAAAVPEQHDTGQEPLLPAAEERYLKDREVAARYGISRQTVWRRKKNGQLPPPVKIAPHSTRWKLSTLMEFERRFNREPTATAVADHSGQVRK
ncbi:helix-turn-helix transcriptional regulator [Sulfitobacter aestuarii]|uniref:Helix-turn-helix transcriptional regulator n=1 Tax=Sulfitobacter aestuarii TaxID=2161676 RepID=A0ABW5TXU4_9RHOB